MHSVKSYFSHSYKQMVGINGSLKFWQKRFYDHLIRDADDFENHLHYIHYNPVRHGLVAHPEDWPHSSFMAWKEKGGYSDHWGWTLPDPLNEFHADDIEANTVSE